MVTLSTHVCSVESLELGEPLLGTAPRADVWFGLEVPMPWGKKAFEDSNIASEVKNHLGAHVDAIPKARLLLIRQSGNLRDGISFFAALSSATPSVLYHFHFTDYSELLDIDLTSIVSQDSLHDHALTDKQTFFICTNGRRDQCCAVHGPGAFRAVREKFGDAVWESSHHSGHRFAANLLALPSGLSYGRLRPDNAVAVVQDSLDGRVSLAHFRGRSTYAEPVQAAEGLLAQELGAGSNALRMVSGVRLDDDRWRVRFAQNGAAHDVVVTAEEIGLTHQSCGDEKTGPMLKYSLSEVKPA
jgi:hypothetical protein